MSIRFFRSFVQRYDPMRMFGYISLIGLVMFLLNKSIADDETKDLTPRYTMVECAEIYLAYEMKRMQQEKEEAEGKMPGRSF